MAGACERVLLEERAILNMELQVARVSMLSIKIQQLLAAMDLNGT